MGRRDDVTAGYFRSDGNGADLHRGTVTLESATRWGTDVLIRIVHEERYDE